MFAASDRSADALFTVLYRRSGSPATRLGLTISAKRVRDAVSRNRLRRLIRESFRLTAKDLGDLDIVVIARDRAAAADNSQVFESLAGHWTRLRGAAATTK